AVPYSAATPNDPALPGEAVTWHNPAGRKAEAETIIQILREAEGRSAILVRKRDALADIVPALKAAGIRYRAIEIERLGEKQVVQDLYALARALSHLGDRVPGRSDPPLFLWKEVVRPPDKGGTGGLLLAPIKETGTDKDLAYKYLKDLDADAEDTESSRLLYVAATRAEKRLHLLACLPS